MGYVSGRKLRIQRQLAKVQASLAILYETFDALAASTTKSYDFESGEGRQRTTRRDLADIQKQIDMLEAKESRLYNDLYNMGLISIRLRRQR